MSFERGLMRGAISTQIDEAILVPEKNTAALMQKILWLHPFAIKVGHDEPGLWDEFIADPRDTCRAVILFITEPWIAKAPGSIVRSQVVFGEATRVYGNLSASALEVVNRQAEGASWQELLDLPEDQRPTIHFVDRPIHTVDDRQEKLVSSTACPVGLEGTMRHYRPALPSFTY